MGQMASNTDEICLECSLCAIQGELTRLGSVSKDAEPGTVRSQTGISCDSHKCTDDASTNKTVRNETLQNVLNKTDS
jgi:hypothetical protein